MTSALGVKITIKEALVHLPSRGVEGLRREVREVTHGPILVPEYEDSGLGGYDALRVCVSVKSQL